MSAPTSPVTAMVVMDTDSYVKWGVDLASRLPPDWRVSRVLLGSYVQPSARQLESAGAPGLRAVSSRSLRRQLATDRPDVLVLAVRGHAVPHIAAMLGDHRPVIVTGMPGIVVPPQRYDIELRRAADLLIVHSLRERREHEAAAALAGRDYVFGLESLALPAVERAEAPADGAIVFATQALVPPRREDRMLVLSRLADAARAFPASRVVIKTRSGRGEAETHRGAEPYDALLAHVPEAPHNLVVSSGSMAEHLASARALVSVSSTALLEAVASGVPALAIADFGVDEAMMTSVFEGSGLLGSLDDVVAGRFRLAEPTWLADNYFHDPDDDDWLERLEALLHARDSLPSIAAPPGGASGLYYRLDALTPWRGTIGEPLERAALALARTLNRVRG